MSRGPGRIQRLILDTVKRQGFLVVCDQFPPAVRHAERSGFYRAVSALHKAGRIDLWRVPRRVPCKRSGPGFARLKVLVVTRVGERPPKNGIQSRQNQAPQERSTQDLRGCPPVSRTVSTFKEDLECGTE
jgi:hypothetical protein